MAQAQNNHKNLNDADTEIELEEGEGSSSVIHELTSEKTQELIEEARNFEKELNNFEAEYTEGKKNAFYVLSKKWLTEWKKQVSFENVIKGQQPNKIWFGQLFLDEINEDLIEDNPKFINLPNYPEDSSFSNVLLRGGIQEGRDYILITEQAWEYISNIYEGIGIKRPVITLPNGERRVEVRLKQIQIVPINNAFLRSLDHDRASEFNVFIFQTTSNRTLKEIQSDLVTICNSEASKKLFEASSPIYSSYAVYSEDTLRFWKLDPTTTLGEMFSYLRGKCKKSTSYEYRIEFKGTFILKDPQNTLDEAEVSENDYVFIEVREQGKGWHFQGENAPQIDRCDFCNKYEELPIKCGCKKVAYCSEECKYRDKRYHEMKCDNSGEEEEQQTKKLSLTHNSRRGLCGLQNLGNTCFMNSGLQCLSNIQALTHYFISDKYDKEINETNPLGTKGKLVRKYATFLKSLWFGSGSVHSPWTLKHAISEFQPMFTGYQQHDSQELLAFLLDGIHEDLNRVKQKPSTEVIESETQPDYEVGMKSWENHLKRNQSIIVDLLHGQFKSKITCPTCSRISITFDPFNSVSLPIPAKKEKEIDFFFLHSNHRNKPTKLSIKFPIQNHTVAQLREETAKIMKIDPKLFYFFFSTQHSKEMIKDEEHTLTNTLRKKKKIKPLFACEITEEELNADPNTYVKVDYQTTKIVLNYFGHPSRRKFTFLRSVSLRKDLTAQEIYMKMFAQYRILWDEAISDEQKEEWNKLSDEEAFHKIWDNSDNKPFRIYLITNARVFHECFFCGEKRCENCELKYDSSIKVSDLLAKIKDPEFELEFEVFFTGSAEGLDIESLNSYTDLAKSPMNEGEETKEKEKDINIYHCFRQFEEPETLGEENAWYCSKCKEHKRATKKMEIFKAPPIMMLHLKRFKSEGSSILSKSKISAKVDFPLENLDISEFVAHPEFPMDYPVERITPGFKQEQNGQVLNGEITQIPNGENGLDQETKNGYVQLQEETKMEEEVTDNGRSIEEEKNPEQLNGVNGNPNALLYDLFAVVNHYGNLGFGHYTAYAKNHVANKWYCFDDSSVMEENEENICSPASYVLFYKRKNWNFDL